LHQKRHALGPCVSRAFGSQAVFAEGRTVFAHMNYEGVGEVSPFAQHGQQSPHAVVRGPQRLPAAAIVGRDVEVGVIGKVHAMPGVALVLPHIGAGVWLVRDAGMGKGWFAQRTARRCAGTNSAWTALREKTSKERLGFGEALHLIHRVIRQLFRDEAILQQTWPSPASQKDEAAILWFRRGRKVPQPTPQFILVRADLFDGNALEAQRPRW